MAVAEGVHKYERPLSGTKTALSSLSFLSTIKSIGVLIYVDGMRREMSRAETLSIRQQELGKLNGYDEILSRARSTDLLDSW